MFAFSDHLVAVDAPEGETHCISVYRYRRGVPTGELFCQRVLDHVFVLVKDVGTQCLEVCVEEVTREGTHVFTRVDGAGHETIVNLINRRDEGIHDEGVARLKCISVDHHTGDLNPKSLIMGGNVLPRTECFFGEPGVKSLKPALIRRFPMNPAFSTASIVVRCQIDNRWQEMRHTFSNVVPVQEWHVAVIDSRFNGVDVVAALHPCWAASVAAGVQEVVMFRLPLRRAVGVHPNVDHALLFDDGVTCHRRHARDLAAATLRRDKVTLSLAVKLPAVPGTLDPSPNVPAKLQVASAMCTHRVNTTGLTFIVPEEDDVLFQDFCPDNIACQLFAPLAMRLRPGDDDDVGDEAKLEFTTLAHELDYPESWHRIWGVETLLSSFYETVRSFDVHHLVSHIYLSYGPPSHHEMYTQSFDCPVTFSAGRDEMVFKKKLLDVPQPTADPLVFAVARRQCESSLAKLIRGRDLVDQVEGILLASGRQFPSIAVVAERLTMSERSLQRRFGELGTSYREITNRIRHQLATELLQSTELPIQEIAYLLGYTEAANFSLAFKQIAGVSPSSLRAKCTD